MTRHKNTRRISRGQKKYIRRLKMEYKQENSPEIVLKIQEAYAKYEERYGK